jgi:hypothetical protein
MQELADEQEYFPGRGPVAGGKAHQKIVLILESSFNITDNCTNTIV